MKKIVNKALKKINEFVYDTGVYWDSKSRRYLYRSKKRFYVWWVIGLIMLIVALFIFPVFAISFLLKELSSLAGIAVKQTLKGIKTAFNVIFAPVFAKPYSEDND